MKIWIYFCVFPSPFEEMLGFGAIKRASSSIDNVLVFSHSSVGFVFLGKKLISLIFFLLLLERCLERSPSIFNGGLTFETVTRFILSQSSSISKIFKRAKVLELIFWQRWTVTVSPAHLILSLSFSYFRVVWIYVWTFTWWT